MKPRLFAEFPAGLAAVSLRLHGGAYCRPPISRMGNKAGYSEAILAALGLRSGLGAHAYAWGEADDDVRALLRCYPDAAMLRRVADIIRGWADEEPRALWERLRAERKARGSAERVAQFVQLIGANRLIPGAFAEDGRWVNAARDGGSETLGGVSFGGEEFATPAETNADACQRLAEYAVVASSNRLINIADDGTGDLRNTGAGGTTFGGAEFGTPAGEVAERFDGLAADVASYSLTGLWSYRAGEPESGYNDAAVRARPRTETDHGSNGRTVALEADRFDRLAAEVAEWVQLGVWSYCQGDLKSGGPVLPGDRRQDTTATATATATARVARSSWPPVAIFARIPAAADVAAMLGTPGDLDGAVVYMDPPYLGTTGYRHDLGRDEVIGIARDYAGLGAVVCISEAEPIEALGWECVEVTGARQGQKRTFSKQQAEWLTMNRTPAHRVARQLSLFGGVA